MTTTEIGKDATVKDGQGVYAVISIRELNHMLKVARAKSRANYGKVVGQSTLSVYAGLVFGYDSANGEIQLDIKERML